MYTTPDWSVSLKNIKQTRQPRHLKDSCAQILYHRHPHPQKNRYVIVFYAGSFLYKKVPKLGVVRSHPHVAGEM